MEGLVQYEVLSPMEGLVQYEVLSTMEGLGGLAGWKLRRVGS